MTRILFVLAVFSFSASAARAQFSDAHLPALEFFVQPKEPEKKKETKKEPAPIDFSQAPESRAEAPTGLNPHMIGDFRLFRLVTIQVPTFAIINFQVPGGPVIKIPVKVTVGRQILVPSSGSGPFKIAENETVMPGDRVYFGFNFMNNVGGPANGSNKPFTTTIPVEFQGKTFPGVAVVPGVATPRLDVSYQTFGFEKTFFDGNFSVGVRIPFFQQNGAQQFSDNGYGDTTLIAKYAPYMDRESGSGISLGLAVTLPTGPDNQSVGGDIHPTILQPFLGYQYNRENFLLFGFTAVAAPTDERDVTLLFNDVGLGYRLFQGEGYLRSVVPALEVHVTTPLNHRSAGSIVQGIDEVALTGGLHLGVGRRSLLTLGVAVPVTGPRLFDAEAICQFNFRF